MNDLYEGTVTEFLPNDLDGLDEVLRENMSRDPRFSSLRIPGFGWRILGAKVNEALRKTLRNWNVLSILAQGWKKAPELSEFADEKKYPPGQPWTVFLGKHEIERSLFPTAEVTCGGVKAGEIEFDLCLVVEVRAVELEILGGHIVAIGSGDFSIGAQLKYGSFKFAPIKSRDFRLTDPYKFSPPGLAIYRSSNATSEPSP